MRSLSTATNSTTTKINSESVDINSAESNVSPNRIHTVDFARGLACISMPFYHTLYNLYTAGLTETLWTKNTFWFVYQKLGLGTFVLVSGMAFVLSTQRGIRWNRLGKRALKLGTIAALITLVTYLAMPHKFVRFGVLHFFTVTILLAPFFRPLGKWAILPGLVIVLAGVFIGKGGLWPQPWLYITGLMNQRPPSIDYIPLMPWLGVFLVGMGLAFFLRPPSKSQTPQKWMQPVIWLGKHSLAFYLLHQAVIFSLVQGLAFILK